MPCPDGHRDGGEAPPTAGDVWTASQWDPATRRGIIEDEPIAALNTVVVILGGALDPDPAQEQLELVTDRANGESEQIGVLPGREHDLVGGEAHALKVADCGMRASSENAGGSGDWRPQLRSELLLGGGLERLTNVERASIEEGRSFEKLFDDATDVQQLAWWLPGSKCEITYLENGRNPWCRCTTTIPATVEAVLEGLWEIDGAAFRHHRKSVELRVLDRPSAHTVLFTLRARIVPILPAFESRMVGTWAAVGGRREFAIVFVPQVRWSEAHAASTRQIALLKPGTCASTTQLTYVFQVGFGSHSTAIEWSLPNLRLEAIRRQREVIAAIKRHFEKNIEAWLIDVEDDCSRREVMITEMRKVIHSYSAEETALIAEGSGLLGAFENGRGKMRSLRGSKTVEVARTKYDPKSGLVIGHVEAIVRGASPEKIVAYLMHFDSKHLMSQWRPEIDVRYEILEVKNHHHIVVFLEMKTPPFQNRTWLAALLWRKISDDPPTFVWAAVPIERHDKVVAEDEAHAVRARCIRFLRLTQIAENTTRMEYACSLDLKGNVPQWLTDRVAIPSLMSVPQYLQRYFLQIKPPDGSVAADGTVIGHMIVDVTETANEAERAAAVETFVERTAILRESRHAFLGALLAATLGESGHNLLPQAVPRDDPTMLTAAEATTIGCGFEAIIRVSAAPSEAVDELLHTYPAMNVAAQRHDWFRPMIETIAKRRVAKSPFGLKFRLAIGALFSIGDMVSDIVQIVTMILAGQSFGAFLLLGMIALNLTFQLFVVILQNAHRGWQVVAREAAIVLSLLKPGIDAIRVGGGEEQVAGAPVDPLVEMVICKASELTFESIPGGLVQVIFVFSGGDLTTAALVSVVFSCLSTAFIATTLSYDLDTNTRRRKRNPEFYGYIPNSSSGRVGAFALLFLYHSVYAFGKTFSMACLAQTNWLWLVTYFIVDHCALILYKLVRGDLIYWVPGLGIPTSILCRLIEKVIMDFTGFIHFRNPLELGGIYFFVNSLTSLASWFVAAALYSKYFPEANVLATAADIAMAELSNSTGASSAGATTVSHATIINGMNRLWNATGVMHANKISDLMLFMMVGTLAVVWLVAVIGLSLTIKREYLHTFVSLQTGRAYIQSYFLDNEGNDAQRIEIFFSNNRLWRAIRDHVRQWVLSMYFIWEALMPAWFSTDVQARIPDDFLPTHDLGDEAA